MDIHALSTEATTLVAPFTAQNHGVCPLNLDEASVIATGKGIPIIKPKGKRKVREIRILNVIEAPTKEERMAGCLVMTKASIIRSRAMVIRINLAPGLLPFNIMLLDIDPSPLENSMEKSTTVME